MSSSAPESCVHFIVMLHNCVTLLLRNCVRYSNSVVYKVVMVSAAAKDTKILYYFELCITTVLC